VPLTAHIFNRQIALAVSDFSLRMQEFLETTALVKLSSRNWMMFAALRNLEFQCARLINAGKLP